MRDLAFPEGCVHAENVGGDIENVLNTRGIIDAFRWKFEAGEVCPCRILAFLGVEPSRRRMPICAMMYAYGRSIAGGHDATCRRAQA